MTDDRPIRRVQRPTTITETAQVVQVGRAIGNLLEERAHRARSDYNNFAEFVMRDSIGNSIKQAVLHRTWALHIEFCWSVGLIPAILAPLGSGKTTQVTVGRVAFEIAQDTNIRAKIICQNDDKAMERVMGISALISQPRYKYLFPHVREVPKADARTRRSIARWTQHDVFLERSGFSIDPSIEAAGVLVSGTGGRADLMVFDDIVDQRNAIDMPELRGKVIDNVDNVWMQRCTPWARKMYIGTPYHTLDYSNIIQGRPAWCVLMQWISEDCKRIEQQVFNAPDDYPLPRLVRDGPIVHVQSVEGSKNISKIAFDPLMKVLEVDFKGGGRYRYFDVPIDLYQAMGAATSKGAFFHQVIRDKFAFEKVETATNGHA